MTKRKFNKLDNIEQEDASAQSQNINIEYNKNNIEKILNICTNKNVEVFLGHVDKQDQDTLHSPATGELIEQIKLYLSGQNKNAQHFLVINLSNKELVESAYLIHLYKNLDWKLDVIPFVNYKQVKDISSYIEDILTEIDVGIIGARMYNDLGITSARIEQVMEHMKLRIQYSKLNKDNFEQYKTKLDAIKFAKPGAYTETHKEILEQISINNYIDTVVINKKELEIFKADIMPHQPSSSNINTEDYNDKAAISLTGETE